MTFTATPKGRRAAGSESGSIIILTALSMAVLLGIVAFAVDASFLYTERNRMSAAADAAAKAAALENQRGVSNLQPFAYREVALLGFNPGGATTVAVNKPPLSGAFAGNSHYVEVLVSQPTSTYFASVINSTFGTVTPLARAVAGTSTPQNCLITTQNMTIGNSQLTLNGCDVGVGGNLSGSNPNAAIGGTPTPGVTVTGTCSGSCSGMGNLQQSAPPPTDPMAGLVAPTVAGSCVPATLDPLPTGCYTTIPSTINTIQDGATIKVTGTMNVSNLSGTNVLIYLTSTASIQAGNNSSLTLTAGTTAPYAGIAVYGDAGSTFTTGNHFSLTVTGAIYMPGTDVSFGNHLSLNSTSCSLLIFRSLDIPNGSGSLQTSGCSGLYGNASFLGVALAE